MALDKNCFYRVQKESFKNFEEAFREREKVFNRVEQCKKFDEEKELGHRELKSRVEEKKRRKGSAVRN